MIRATFTYWAGRKDRRSLDVFVTGAGSHVETAIKKIIHDQNPHLRVARGKLELKKD